MTKSMTKRQLQAINTKKKIYDVAIGLFNKKGFDQTTIEDISKEANVSVGAFYHYYKSKDDIYFELYKIADRYFEEDVYPKLEGRSASEQLLIYFEHYARYNSIQGIDAIRQLYNSKNKNFVAKGRYMKVLLDKIVSEGIAGGHLKSDMTYEEVSEFYILHARGVIYDWCLHDGDYDLKAKMNRHISHLNEIFHL